MSFREITMQDASEVLRRWQAGQSARRIARETGLDRKTVSRYLDEAREGLAADTLVTEEVARAVGKEVQTRSLPRCRRRRSNGRRFCSVGSEISGWLSAERPLRLVRVHELLAREEVLVGYTTLRQYAQRELGWRKKQPTVRLDDPAPGGVHVRDLARSPRRPPERSPCSGYTVPVCHPVRRRHQALDSRSPTG